MHWAFGVRLIFEVTVGINLEKLRQIEVKRILPRAGKHFDTAGKRGWMVVREHRPRAHERRLSAVHVRCSGVHCDSLRSIGARCFELDYKVLAKIADGVYLELIHHAWIEIR